MSPAGLDEHALELASVMWLELAGWKSAKGSDVAPPEDATTGADAERGRWSDVVLRRRLRGAIERLNPGFEDAFYDEALRELERGRSPDLVEDNHRLHSYMVDGVKVERVRPDRTVQTEHVRLVDFDHVERNDWLAVRQFAIRTGRRTLRRLDLVLFLNGMPVGVIELKSPTAPSATVRDAWGQLQTYKHEHPELFVYNVFLVIADGTTARIGSLTADFERFMPWRRFGQTSEEANGSPLEELLRDACKPARVLDFIRYYTVFERTDDGKVKKLAGYHQVHAVGVAVDCTLQATGDGGDRRVGVVWHTQGSGKSLTMALYAGRIARHPAMDNPTLVLLVDRDELVQQLFESLERWHGLLGNQRPERIESREGLRERLRTSPGGGVLCATLQMFMPKSDKGETRMPLLSDRRNVVVIADEAHRSHYGFVGGYAQHLRDALPEASFIAFTGTPLSRHDRNTRAVFGDYISVYDIQRAVEDHATVPIYYEFRAPRLDLRDDERPKIDPSFEEVTEGQEVTLRNQLAERWSSLEAVMGSESVVREVARDAVEHFERRLDAMEGKAMLVCMSRRICVAMHDAIRALRPQWFDEDDARGQVKVVMTGDASDGPAWQDHIRNEPRRRALAARFRRADDPFRLAIVRDMWLTGFDVPSMHTLYVARPLRDHGLLQTIARVNRVWRDKGAGLVVDYIGLAEALKEALRHYLESGAKGEPYLPIEDAVSALITQYEVCATMMRGFDRTRWDVRDPTARLAMLRAAHDHIVRQNDGKVRFVENVRNLTRAYAWAVTSPEAERLYDDVSFYQAVRGSLMKTETSNGGAEEKAEHAVRQILARAVYSDQVVNVLQMADIPAEGVAILSEDFLGRIHTMPERHRAIDILQKLLSDEIKRRGEKSVVQERTFRERLEATLNRYRTRTLETVEVIELLIGLAREMRDATDRGLKLGLDPAEAAFYEALVDNDSARAMADDVLKSMARDLKSIVQREARIDWTERESVKARLRTAVKRLLRRNGYPPDRQESATQTVLEQAKLLGEALSDASVADVAHAW